MAHWQHPVVPEIRAQFYARDRLTGTGFSGIGTPGNPIFFDDFDYVVGREDLTAPTTFGNRGWAGVKSVGGTAEPGAFGYIYTVNAIPGYAGTFPGGGSRCLCLESQGTAVNQTDFFLQYGQVSGDLPAEHWMQYWIYPQHHEGSSQLSQYSNRWKWMYFTNEAYPSHSHNVHWAISGYTNNPTDTWMSGVEGAPSDGDFTFYITPTPPANCTILWTGPGGNLDILDQCGPGALTGTWFCERNQWTLVRHYVNTTNTTGCVGRLWLKKQTDPDFTLVIDCDDASPNYTYTRTSAFPGSHVAMRMPTTGNTSFFIYMTDFAIAANEADLPTYS